MQHQRCRACGKEWPSHDQTTLKGALYLLVVLLPQFWYHHRFGCKKLGK